MGTAGIQKDGAVPCGIIPLAIARLFQQIAADAGEITSLLSSYNSSLHLFQDSSFDSENARFLEQIARYPVLP